MSALVNPEDYVDIPARALNMSIRNFLSHMLDRDEVSQTSRHLLKNWTGLAELLGCDYDTILKYGSHGGLGKTRMLLGDYTMTGGNVARLLLALRELERYDILEDQGFQDSLRADVATYVAKQQQQQVQRREPPEQDPEVTSAGLSYPCLEMEDGDSVALTIQDGLTRSATTYDAYVIHADEDIQFVLEMITQLETKFGLRLCISNRDMLAGAAHFAAIAALIKKRCAKVIVVMSPSFRSSPMCTFATNFAFSLCPSTLRGILVPILYEPCQIPDILLYISPLDFTKVEYIQWFWARLQHSLQPSAVASVAPLPSTSREEPPPYEESDRARRDIDIPEANSSTQDTAGTTGGATGGSESVATVGGVSGVSMFRRGSNTSASRSANTVKSKKKTTFLLGKIMSKTSKH